MDQQKPVYSKRKVCRLCGSPELVSVLNLQPIVVSTPNIDMRAVQGELKNLTDVKIPLELFLCKGCGHLQLLHIVDPELQYRHFQYVTSVSSGLPEHFREMAGEIVDTSGLPQDSFVVEIGSNDGTLLKAFSEKGMRVLGIDPAEKIAAAATKAGVETLPEFFNQSVGEKISQDFGKADVIVANNTFANLDDLNDIMAGIDAVLSSEGLLVIETQYGRDVIEKRLIDTIYHEHLSYFMVSSLQSFFKRHQMQLIDVERIWTKGGSIRCFVQRKGAGRPVTSQVNVLVQGEINDGFQEPEFYKNFSAEIGLITAHVKSVVAAANEKGQTIIGYGASVGTMTLIAQFDLTDILAYIVDDSPVGANVIIAGREIPVHESDHLYKTPESLVVMFAWRYMDQICERHSGFSGDRRQFLVPLPEVRLI